MRPIDCVWFQVGRLEVRSQPLAQIEAYLERQMGLTQSESNEVLRRSGIDPTAGISEYRDDAPGGPARNASGVVRTHAI